MPYANIKQGLNGDLIYFKEEKNYSKLPVRKKMSFLLSHDFVAHHFFQFIFTGHTQAC